MSILDSLFVGVFGMTVVFVVLVGLSLLVKLQSALFNRFSHKKTAVALSKCEPAAVVLNEEPAVIEETAKQVRVISSGVYHGERPRQEYSGSVGTKKKIVATLNGKVYEAEVEEVNIQSTQETEDTTQYIAAPAPQAPAAAPTPVKTTASVTAPSAGPVTAGSEVITSPVPGTVIEVKTAVGAKVKCGDILLLLEAMKMENEIAATRDGIVAQVMTSKGASVCTGTPLIAISDGGM